MSTEGASSPSRQKRRANRTAERKRLAASNIVKSLGLATNPIFLGLFTLLALALMINFVLVAQASQQDENDQLPGMGVPEAAAEPDPVPALRANSAAAVKSAPVARGSGPHMYPPLPYLPVFAPIDNAEKLADDTMAGKPTIAGIVVVLGRFLKALNAENKKNSDEHAEVEQLISSYFRLAKEYLAPFDAIYRGKPIFPIREDGSVFVSLAAFREHLLGQTLRSAFSQATHPDRIFIGAVIQNCYALNGVQCKTGMQVIGKNQAGRDMTKISDAPADPNGIEEFCTDPEYKKYCESGQVRVLYVHDTDALGPAIARYYASKLWGGETYFMQMDSHLEFAKDWDDKYIKEVTAAKNYPKAVLSAYPPGFTDFGTYTGGTPGARLCTCEFSTNGVEEHIIRINTGMRCSGHEPRPTQIAFIAAGFFFARAEFLVDVPFDPFLPWCFMGEEIALSMRAWTAGWDIYAPRQNLIAHQYRPGRLGLPKFWESVGRDSGRPNLNTRLQKHVIRRVKHLVGYPEDTREAIVSAGDHEALTEFDGYALGTERTREAYLELTNIDPVTKQCSRMEWCNKGELE